MVTVQATLMHDLNTAEPEQGGQNHLKHVPVPTIRHASEPVAKGLARHLVSVVLLGLQVIEDLFCRRSFCADNVLRAFKDDEPKSPLSIIKDLGEAVEVGGLHDFIRFGAFQPHRPHLQLRVEVGHGPLEEAAEDLARRLPRFDAS